MSIVVDSAVWFDLHRSGLAFKVLKLDVCTVDVVVDELIVGPSGDELVKQGLRICTLTGDAVEQATEWRAEDERLSFADAAALALAQSKGYQLATRDGALEELAAKEGVETLGLLDLVERMANEGLLTMRDLERLKKELYEAKRPYDKAAVKRIEKLVKK